jgi:hypothetical protein
LNRLDAPKMWHAAMFKLTRQEQLLLAFLIGALLLGSAVRQWRSRQNHTPRGHNHGVDSTINAQANLR